MEIREAWLVWRSTSHINKFSPCIYFDSPPGIGDIKDGPKIVSGPHKLTGDILAIVNREEGGAPWGLLAQLYPPPRDEVV